MTKQPRTGGFGIPEIDEMLQEAGIRLNGRELEQLLEFHRFLRVENESLNMTRIHQFESVVRKHYVDSIIVIQLLKEAGLSFPSKVMDLGTGPGFPGIPLAIADSKTHFILTEGRRNRVDFLERAVKLLGLSNASVLGKKVYSGFSYPVEGVITRAFASMGETVDRLRGCLSGGGTIYFMKGPHCDEEIEELLRLPGSPCELILDRAYTLPHSRDKRRLVVFRYTPAEESLPNSRSSDAGEPGESSRERNRERFLEITSEENPRFKTVRTLQTGRMIKKHGLAILQGIRLVREFLEEFPHKAEALLLKEGRESPEEQIGRLYEDGEESLPPELPAWIFAKELFDEIDFAGTGSPLLLIRVEEIPLLDEQSEESCEGPLLYLPLSDPENLGAALRSAAAFGITDVVLTEEAAHPYHPTSIRASAGELFHLNFYRGPSLKKLASKLPLFALDAEGEEIRSVEFPQQFGLVVGQEGPGVPESLEARRIRIPIAKKVESLNASVAVGIALYELSLRKK